MKHKALREKLIATARRMNAAGINQGKSGNLSVRVPEGILVTPSGLAYDTMTPEDIVPMDRDGNWAGARKPSSEWRFHLDILNARTDADAVLHCHSTAATAVSCLRRPIPAFHYMVAVAGGSDIRCAPYATFGTQELSEVALAALEGRRACLLANHGMIAIATDIDRALDLAVEVEALARQYLLTLSSGAPVVLDDAEMARVIEKFASYGQR